MIDSATRMGFLIFLPFVLIAKGASLPTVGLALTLVFAGGAAGKLVCAFIGARHRRDRDRCLTEGLTTVGILALLPLPLEAALVVLPVIGIMLNGTSSVLYGSVPELVEPAKRTRMFGIFYTGTIGSGAVAPALYGLVGDALGVPTALMVVAGVCLLTLPLALVLRPMLPASSRVKNYRQSPSTAWTSASAATAAVSARRMRGPSDSRTILVSLSSAARSSSAKPPSGPISSASGCAPPPALDIVSGSMALGASRRVGERGHRVLHVRGLVAEHQQAVGLAGGERAGKRHRLGDFRESTARRIARRPRSRWRACVRD